MQQLPKEFIGRMVRTVLFIGLVAACCAGVATFGMLVASKFNLTTSRNQVPLTSVKIEGGKVLIPENGKTTREAGWTLRNSRGQYILTLDEMEAGSLIICEGAQVSKTITKVAKEHNCLLITTKFDTYTVARLINQSMPIRFLMKEKEGIVKFQTEDFIEDIQTVMAKLRHRDFPVEDTQGNYVGMISRRNLLGAGKKKLILVDHNERGQAVNGVETAEILEIIDHHRLGAIQTVSPVFFRNQPLGSTATIIYHMYQENQVEIDKNTAALLCSAIISDTLIFKSPTCTSDDVAACMQLAKKAELDIETYGREMFRAGSNLSGKSAKEIFYQDYKKFSVNNVAIGVGQINSMSAEELEKVKPRLAEFIQGVVQDNSAGIVYFLLTDIVSESSEVLCAGNNANAVIYQAFGVEVKDDCVKLQGVVSRKKQFFPAIVEALQQ